MPDIYHSAKDIIIKLFQASWFKYLFVGGTTVMIDVGSLVLLHEIVGLRPVVAATFSYWLGVAYNFSLNRHWTFDAGGSQFHSHAIKYGILLVINYGVTIGFIGGLGHFGVNYAIAKIVAILISMSWTYYAYKHIIFVDHSPKQTTD